MVSLYQAGQHLQMVSLRQMGQHLQMVSLHQREPRLQMANLRQREQHLRTVRGQDKVPLTVRMVRYNLTLTAILYSEG